MSNFLLLVLLLSSKLDLSSLLKYCFSSHILVIGSVVSVLTDTRYYLKSLSGIY